MIDGLPTMAQAEQYKRETKDMSPAAKGAVDEILGRMVRHGQDGQYVSIWDVKDVLERLCK